MLHYKKYDFLSILKSSITLIAFLIITGCSDTSTENITPASFEPVDNALPDVIKEEVTVSPPVEPVDVKVLILLQELNVSVGDIVTADIIQESLSVLEGGGVNLQYDPQSIEVQEVKVDANVWTFGHHNGVIDNSSGVVTDIVFASYNGVQGENNIATITIKVFTNEMSEIKMTESSLNPFASKGRKVSADFESLLIN